MNLSQERRFSCELDEEGRLEHACDTFEDKKNESISVDILEEIINAAPIDLVELDVGSELGRVCRKNDLAETLGCTASVKSPLSQVPGTAPLVKQMLPYQIPPEMLVGHFLSELPKRQKKCIDEPRSNSRELAEGVLNIPPLPLFSTVDARQPVFILQNQLKKDTQADKNFESHYDLFLSEELEENPDSQVFGHKPVPLLTPPASPIEVEIKKGQQAVCEWPSNLATDTAITAPSSLRSFSPRSLTKQGEDKTQELRPKRPETPKGYHNYGSPTGLTPIFPGFQLCHSLMLPKQGNK